MKNCFCLSSCESQPKREARSEAKRSEANASARKRTQARSEVHSRSSSRSIHPDQKYDLTSNKKVGMFAVVRNHHRVFGRRHGASSQPHGLSSRRSSCRSVSVAWTHVTTRRDRQIALNQSTLTSRGPLAPATCRPLAAGRFSRFLPIGDGEVTNLKVFNRADTTPNFWPFVS